MSVAVRKDWRLVGLGWCGHEMVWEGVRLEEVGARRQSQDPVTWQSLRPPAAIHGNLKNVPTPTSSENAEAYLVTRYSESV